MRRTLERRQFPVSGVARGELVVPSTFTHPTRGQVSCPAAPVAATPVRHTPLRAGEDGILHTVSYLDPSGAAVGLAVAAHREDEQAQRTAENIVTTWAAVMRTRRVLLETTGPSCTGLRHEAAMIARAGGPVTVLAPPPTRRDVSSRWPWRDAHLTENLTDVPPNTTVVLPAHGNTTTAKDREAAKARNIRILDATCPLVAQAQATTRRFANEHALVIVIAGPQDAAAPPLTTQAPNTKVVTTIEDIEALDMNRQTQLAYVVSPGLPTEDATTLATHLRKRFPRTIGQHPNELCYAASDRRAAIQAVASCTELTLVLGTPTSPDTQAATKTAKTTAKRVEHLTTLTDLQPDWLTQTTSIGILATASTPQDLPGTLIEVLSGLGPLSVAHRKVTTEVNRTTQQPTKEKQAS